MSDFLNKWRDEGFRTLLLTLIAGGFLGISFFGRFSDKPFDPAWVAILLCGIPIVYGAVKGLVTAFDVTADVLVAIALIAALCIGEFFAAGEVAFIMQIGKVLEDYTAGKSRKGLQALINLTPQKAFVRMASGDNEILASEVKKGDILLVRPGEIIPVDGIVLRGSTSVNQAIMTGESIPVDRGVGDAVYQGALNQEGVIDMEATQVGEDSSLQKMIRLVEEAEENKAPMVRLADQWARILVPVALGCALIIYFWTQDIYRAVTALVVFCPCSLILATPTAMMATIGNATQKGILIKSGAAVEALAKIDTIVIDKTGTLTYGKLHVEEVMILVRSFDQSTLFNRIASAEKFSEHPLGKAVVSYCKELGIEAQDPESFEMQTGKGVIATVNGQKICVGEKTIDQESMDHTPEVALLMNQLQNKGKTVLPVSVDGKVIALISIADALRREAKDTLVELKKIGLSRIVMLTGDHPTVAHAIGSEAGITEIVASQLPEDKMKAIQALSLQGHSVGMVGDGVNDAPALATASVGIVMGAIGSDIAIEAADIALMSDDFSKLPFLLSICRETKSRILFNIVISMILNFGAIVLAGYGLLNPVTAALVHNFGSVFVVVNSAMLLGYKEQAF